MAGAGRVAVVLGKGRLLARKVGVGACDGHRRRARLGRAIVLRQAFVSGHARAGVGASCARLGSRAVARVGRAAIGVLWSEIGTLGKLWDDLANLRPGVGVGVGDEEGLVVVGSSSSGLAGIPDVGRVGGRSHGSRSHD